MSVPEHKNIMSQKRRLMPIIDDSRRDDLNRSIDKGSIPNARLGYEDTFDTSLLGSSQLTGCQGDFCDYDFTLSSDISFDDSKIAESNLMMSTKKSSKSHSSKTSLLIIPSKIVYQTRQEMPLVKRFLDRYQCGEKVDYIKVENYNDLAIGVKLPGHYYTDLQCCSKCYQVYKIIGNARDSAIRKISTSKVTDGNEVKSSHTVDGLQRAKDAINTLNKLDIAEIRTMVKPPAAVEVVVEAVMCLLFGKLLTFDESKQFFGLGDKFLQMLNEFRVEDVTDETLRLVEPYTDNPIFRPENVLSVSYCAAKFCAWVLGVVQATKWQRGQGHARSDVLPASSSSSIEGLSLSKLNKSNKSKLNKTKTKNKMLIKSNTEDDLSFVEKLAKRNEIKKRDSDNNSISRAKFDTPKDFKSESKISDYKTPKTIVESALLSNEHSVERIVRKSNPIAQKKAVDRLSSHDKMEGNSSLSGNAKDFRCSDGLTKMPYIVIGGVSLTSQANNFIIFHDIFDTCDSTSLMCKPIIKRHDGCQVLTFNYPGQANTIWPRLSVVEKERGAREPTLENEWICDKIHELIEHAEVSGDISFSTPFHMIGIGYGACIASSLYHKWGNHPRYANLRSLVSINGFLYPDSQLSSIFHSATHIFESSPHNRPDIPVSYWSSFILSDDYLSKVNPNLALNLSTAVSNPITNEGRCKLLQGCLEHRNLQNRNDVSLNKKQIPIILMQSTENKLINPTNVDPFLTGRNTRHLWSHQLNYLSSDVLKQALDSNAKWVGKMSSSPSDYQKFSILGKNGLRMVLDTLNNPTGAFVMWVRSGHCILQENKTCFLDLLDVLASPTEQYAGFDDSERNEVTTIPLPIDTRSPKMEVLFHAKTHNTDLTAATVVDADRDKKETAAKSQVDGNSGILKNIITDVFVESKTMDLPSSKNNIAIQNSRLKNDNTESESETKDHIEDIPLPRSTKTTSTIPKVEPSREQHTEDSPLPRSTKTTSTIPKVEPSREQHTEDSPLPRSTKTTSTIPKVEPSREQHTEDSPLRSGNIASSSKVEPSREHATLPMLAPPPFPVATKVQKEKRAWTENVPDVSNIIELEAMLENRIKEFENISVEEDKISNDMAVVRADVYNQQQLQDDNEILLKRLKEELEIKQMERTLISKQHRIELQNAEEKMIKNENYDDDSNFHDNLQQQQKQPEPVPEPVREMPPVLYVEPRDLPTAITQSQSGGLSDQFDDMLRNEEIARKKGIMSLEAYENVKGQMLVNQIDRDNKLRNLAGYEQQALLIESVCTIQRVGRGYMGRGKAHIAATHKRLRQRINTAAIKIQSIIRGFIGRRRFKVKLQLHKLYLKRAASIILIQSAIRGCLSRKYVKKLKYKKVVVTIQRFFRGHLGRIAVKRERNRLGLLHKKYQSASVIQSTWRMKVAKEEFRSLRIHMLAAIEIQRCYRGYVGRKQMKRRRVWESTAPGPDRIKLGMKVIEESKLAFEKQQEEIDALHRAQERAEARVSHIHAELKDAEKELTVLERELQEIDQIERDLQTLTHEKELLRQNVKNATGLPRTALGGHEDIILGKESNSSNDPDVERRRKAEAYALEMTLQIKRAEREKKKQELETEFASVFKEVDKKRKALERLELSLADMESTRERKDREFRRLQNNLMQLLLEQKQELDDLREKGIELETATATTAAAATATAQKAKEHEIRSNAMFSQTEELMKFQFMSMSLSYFSSLNMLKQLRDMNADTTTAAVTSSADAAGAAAAAAAAANLPSIKKMNLGANDFVELSIQKKKAELELSEHAEVEAKKSKANPFPESVKTWTISDVCRWLDTIYLGQYVSIFKEACIDGPFLMELREEDFVQVLGMKHKLHVRKILIFREKLKPLSEQDLKNKAIVEREETAEDRRNNVGVPTADAVFSQARNGRIKRVEESLNLGFKVDAEDERGNTLLLVAAQNSNKKLVEILLVRGANINHQNAQGNTALHFALAFDSEGMLGEYLIEHGADDTIENVEGLTPYDGIV